MNCPKCQFVLPDDKAAECPFCHVGLKAGPAAAPPAALPPVPQFQPPQAAAPPAAAPPPRAAVPPPSTATPRPMVPPPVITPRPMVPPPVITPRPMVPPPIASPPGLMPPLGAPQQAAPPGAIPPFAGPPPRYPPVSGAAGIPPAPIPSVPTPGAPGLTPPGFPGLMPPSMLQPSSKSSAPPGIPTPGVNPDPLNLEGLHRSHEAPPDPLADPFAQMKQGAPPPPQPGAPTPNVGMPGKSEIEWEAPPPPKSKKNLLPFAVLAIVGVGWQTGFLSLDVFYGMLSKGVAPAPTMEPLPPAGQQGNVQRPGHQDWNIPQPTPSKAPVAPEPEPTPEPTQAPKPRDFWTFEGRLYDMMTLRPVFAAELKFEAQGEKTVSVQTNDRGHYRAKVPALDEGSYQITIVHPDYNGKKYFDEINPPYKTLDPEERKMLQRVIPSHKPWTGRVGAKTQRDLVLLRATHHIESTDKPADGKPEGDAPPEEAR